MSRYWNPSRQEWLEKCTSHSSPECMQDHIPTQGILGSTHPWTLHRQVMYGGDMYILLTSKH
jgi:hypothetical protein